MYFVEAFTSPIQKQKVFRQADVTVIHQLHAWSSAWILWRPLIWRRVASIRSISYDVSVPVV